MSDPIIEENPAPEDITLPTEPTTPPARSVIIQMQFETEGEQPAVYNARVEHSEGAKAIDFSKSLAEIVERTALLHLGALPVLSKVEVPA